ncbi:MAG: DNA polymerase III subunit delta [Pseudomonadota bacterium]
MPTLDSEALAPQLARGLAPLYAIHGEEPLLAIEAADRIRARARDEGYSEREVLTVESGFDWSQLAAAGASLSLFGARKLVELRIPTGKPGTAGAQAIADYCKALPPDLVTLVEFPRLERAALSSRWVSALEAAGVMVRARPVPREKLPAWLAGRLKAQDQQADRETLEFIAERVEGNLLAAYQEVRKLGLLFPAGKLAADAVRSAVLNVARYEPAQAGEALLTGDLARLSRVLDGLRGEGAPVPLMLWQIADDVRAACRVSGLLARGEPAQRAIKAARVWGPRQTWVGAAARRLTRRQLDDALSRLATIDRIAKGVARGDVWQELAALGLELAARPRAGRRETV